VPPYQVPALSMRAAWGQVAMRSYSASLPDHHHFVFEDAATPDGQWLVGVIQPDEFSDKSVAPSFLALLNVASGQIVTIRQLLHPQSQVLGASADDHWIVWSESNDVIGYSYPGASWAMFAYNRQNGQITQLAAPARVNGQLVQGGDPAPLLDRGHLLWSQAVGPVGPTGNLTNLVVRLEDLASGTTSILATSAESAALAWPWATWDQLTPGANGSSSIAGITLKNVVTGQTVTFDQTFYQVELYGTSLVYTDYASVWLLNDFTRRGEVDGLPAGQQTVFSGGAYSAVHPQFPSLNDRLVAWSSYVTTQVYDRAARRLVAMPSPNGPAYTWVGGRLLAWLAPGPNGNGQMTIEIVDTSTLPVR
jgi:hypothetical protein